MRYNSGVARRITVLISCVAVVLAFGVSHSEAAAPIDFNQQIRPMLSDKCYGCHGPDENKRKAGLRLDQKEGAFAELKSGNRAIVPGNLEKSALAIRIASTEPEEQMPPPKSGKKLSAQEIETFREWIKQGAVWQQHWAYVAPPQPRLPQVKATDWPRNAIDYFVLWRIEKENVTPSPEADRYTLLRRVTLDLTGLPPTPEEIEAFIADTDPLAYERVVEHLLASPHYGERWGRWWLDAARYADSNGYSIDAPRQIWKYRDWVVAALNRDMPFDQFTIEQLAGDLLPNASVEQKIATGFNRNTQINQEGGIDPEQFRVESVIDRVNTFSTVFLGLTVGCAQCHNHKFDPITQRDYYQLFAFFNQTVQDGHGQGSFGGVMEIPNEFEPPESLEKELEEVRGDLQRFLDGQGNDVAKWEAALSEEEKAKLAANVREAVGVPWPQRTFEQKRAVYLLVKPENPDFKPRHSRFVKLEKRERKRITTLVMEEAKEPRQTFIFVKGDFTRPSEKVGAGFPEVLHKSKCVPVSEKPLTRLDLAHWVVDPANPLTARVTVNRIWQQYFGRGIVETENDFGSQGTPPSNPELLDYLAWQFMSGKNPWSMKAIHRLIVTSATYRQSSRVRPELALNDPSNHLLARQSRLRLDAELIRDAGLASSGLLNEQIGGPPVYPPQPDGVMTLGQVKREWKASAGSQRYRRAIYTHFWRATPYPALSVFDSPDAFSACTRRMRSNTPLQALTLLNDTQFYEFAQALASRVQHERLSSDDARIEFAFRSCLGRPPAANEKERLNQLLTAELHRASNSFEAWVALSRVLLNLDETITRE